MANTISGIGRSITEEAGEIVHEGKKVIVESARDALDTFCWAISFGLFSIATESREQSIDKIPQSEKAAKSSQHDLVKSLKAKDRKASNIEIKRYKDMIEREKEVHKDEEGKMKEWRSRVDKQMHGEDEAIPHNAPPADLSDVGSVEKNPSLFARKSSERDRKKGM